MSSSVDLLAIKNTNIANPLYHPIQDKISDPLLDEPSHHFSIDENSPKSPSPMTLFCLGTAAQNDRINPPEKFIPFFALLMEEVLEESSDSDTEVVKVASETKITQTIQEEEENHQTIAMDPNKLMQNFILLMHEHLDSKAKQAEMDMDQISRNQKRKEALFEKIRELNISIYDEGIVSFFGTLSDVAAQITVLLALTTVLPSLTPIALAAALIAAVGKAVNYFFKTKNNDFKAQSSFHEISHDLFKNDIKRSSKAVTLRVEEWRQLAQEIKKAVENDLAVKNYLLSR